MTKLSKVPPPKAMALNIGLNGVSAAAYEGWDGPLAACEADARDVNHEEADRKDETWCLYDGQLIDDELYFELSRFAKGVRIRAALPASQSPNLFVLGDAPRFLAQTPFTV